MGEFRQRYHQFLNTAASRDVEPSDLLAYLRPHRIFDQEEEELIRNEATRAQRQFCFFLKLLPTKGLGAKEAVHSALKQTGYTAAAKEWEQYVKPSCDVTDSYVVPVVAEQFQASAMTAIRYQGQQKMMMKKVELPPERSRMVEEQGGAAPSPEGEVSPEPICVQTRTLGLMVESQRPSPPGAPPAASFVSLHQQTRTIRSAVAAVPPPPEREEVVEEVAFAVHTSGLTAPPTSHPEALSADLGSTGIPSRTPDSFFESAPSFAPVARIAPVGEEVEKSLNAKDVQLGEEIGRGFYAVVYVGQYANRKVAVKKFRDYDEFSLAMFIEEINIMKELNHRNVVKFIGYVHSSQDRQLWLLTEFVAGGALRRFCTPPPNRAQLEKSLPLRDKVKITIECWQGLDYIHSKSLCHKDISPGNILVSNDLTQVKISDFGLAEFKNLIMTAMTQVSGTPMYYPPEFASENGVIRHPVKSDIYSMGATLCELFSEQWFWNINGQPRSQFQVMFVLSEAQRIWTEKGQAKDPDCWEKIPPKVQPMLKDAIRPDYRKRKSARELVIASQEILKELK